MPDIVEKVINAFTANVAITTTSEIVAATSDPAKIPFATVRIVIRGWVQLTTGTGTTTVTLRIRRGTTTAGTLIGEANAVTVGAAAGSTEQFQIVATETLADIESAQYVLTVQQAGATADGTALAGAIEVEVLNG